MKFWNPDIPIRAYNKVVASCIIRSLNIIDFLIDRSIDLKRFDIRALLKRANLSTLSGLADQKILSFDTTGLNDIIKANLVNYITILPVWMEDIMPNITILKTSVYLGNIHIIELVLTKMLECEPYVDRPTLCIFPSGDKNLIVTSAIEFKNKLIMKFLIDDEYANLHDVMYYIIRRRDIVERNG